MYRVLSLFAGIGGFDLGLERTGGFRTVAFCEIDPFCRRVLAKHWPSVPCYHDVRDLTAERLASDGIEVDCIVGGFPCQDISLAGKGAGLGGERSGLWSEYARLIGELRPSIVVVENVSALLARGLDTVLGTLAALGMGAEWHCIPASYLGAPHRRDRVWIVATANAPALLGSPILWRKSDGDYAGARKLADANGIARHECGPSHPQEGQGGRNTGRSGLGQDVAHAQSAAIGARFRSNEPGQERRGRLGNGHSPSLSWAAEPDVGRVAHGVPSRVDRLRSLGNAVVPQIPEMIGRAILAADAERLAA